MGFRWCAVLDGYQIHIHNQTARILMILYITNSFQKAVMFEKISSILVNIFQNYWTFQIFLIGCLKKKDFGNLLQSDNCPYVERFWKHFSNKHDNLSLYLIVTLLKLWYSFFFYPGQEKLLYFLSVIVDFTYLYIIHYCSTGTSISLAFIRVLRILDCYLHHIISQIIIHNKRILTAI